MDRTAVAVTTDPGRHRAAMTSGQLAAAALRWQASDDPYPPESIADLSTADQAALARAAHRVVAAAHDATDRCQRGEG